MAQVCRSALVCEALRGEIFAGKRSPVILGQPDAWMGLLVQANQTMGEGKYEASQKLRAKAFDAAPATGGSADDARFEWIADADSRLGPVLEAIVDGKYCWVPFAAINQIQIEAPTDLRDLVWLPAHFTWANGGEAVGLIPTRYPDSETSEDSAIQLARKTEWIERPGNVYLGLGQRMFVTDNGEFSLLQMRRLELDHSQAS
jgi:type VI secretion system protein ImpE